MAVIRTDAERDRYCTFLCGLALPLDIESKPHKPTRSSEQLGAMFGLAYKVIMEETGLRGDADKKKLHRDFCGAYWGWKVREVLGKKWRDPIRTTTTDENGKRVAFGKVEQAEFYGFIEQTAAECGIFIPSPDPNWRKDQ